MNYTVSILAVGDETHNVKRFQVEKPAGFTFMPGQAVELAINDSLREENWRPFTITSLPDDPYLEFIIKRYPHHGSVTSRLHELSVGDSLLITEAWGAIHYVGEGYFFAGGTGITPFIAIFRHLAQQGVRPKNTLFAANKTSQDIIRKEELETLLGAGANFLLTDEQGRPREYLDEGFISSHVLDTGRYCYLCGPDDMVASIKLILLKLGVDESFIVHET